MLSNAFSHKNAVNAFEACGIYPLNRAKITKDKLSVSEPLTSEACITAGGSPSHDSVPVPVPVNTPNTSPLPVVTPRKRLEAAILSHLKQNTPSAVPTAGRKRVKRTLAESITSSECLERLEKEDEGKHAKKLSKVQKKQQDTRCVNKPKESKVKPNSNKSEAKTVVVRKPTWFKERPAAGLQRSTNDVSVDSVSEASAQQLPHDNSTAGSSTVDLPTPHENTLSLPNCSSTQPVSFGTFGTTEKNLVAGWF